MRLQAEMSQTQSTQRGTNIMAKVKLKPIKCQLPK